MSELTPLSSDELEALAYQCDHDLPPSLSEYRRLIAMARLALPPTVSAPTGEPSARLQGSAHPTASPRLAELQHLWRNAIDAAQLAARFPTSRPHAQDCDAKVTALDAALVALAADAERWQTIRPCLFVDSDDRDPTDTTEPTQWLDADFDKAIPSRAGFLATVEELVDAARAGRSTPEGA